MCKGQNFNANGQRTSSAQSSPFGQNTTNNNQDYKVAAGQREGHKDCDLKEIGMRDLVYRGDVTSELL